MSVASLINPKDVLGATKTVVPSLCYSVHKGQRGKTAVLGGCTEYTGAPYYAAFSALMMGADLSHIFCSRDAGTAIKSYSPDIIVHPVMDESHGVRLSDRAVASVEDVNRRIFDWLPRLDCLVVGPGLGRDPMMQECATAAVKEARRLDLPVVLDGDGVQLALNSPDCIRGYKNAVITPNVNEFGRLYTNGKSYFPKDLNESISTAEELSRRLGGVTILQKGKVDVITNGEATCVCDEEGSPRRCGGQGDILAGTLGTFMAWLRKAPPLPEEYAHVPGTLAACYGAATVTRMCAHRAFEKSRRSTIATKIIDEIGVVSDDLFGV